MYSPPPFSRGSIFYNKAFINNKKNSAMKKITTLAFLSMAALSINAAEYLDISPNPTSDILTVNTEANKMEVYGLNGVLAIEAAGNQINVSSLSAG